LLGAALAKSHRVPPAPVSPTAARSPCCPHGMSWAATWAAMGISNVKKAT